MRKFLVGLLAIFSSAVWSAPASFDHREHAEARCEYLAAEADVTAARLESPSIVSSIGKSETSGSSTLSMGAVWSASGRSLAAAIRRLAEVECSQVANRLQTEAALQQIKEGIVRDSAEAELRAVVAGISLTENMVASVRSKVRTGVATLPRLQAARQHLIVLEQRKAELTNILSASAKEPESLVNLVNDSFESHRLAAEVARAKAKVAAAQSWDVLVTAGYRKELSSGSSPYVGVSLMWNLSNFGETSRAHRLSAAATAISQSFKGAPVGELQDLKAELKSMLASEEARVKAITTAREETVASMTSLRPIQSEASELAGETLAREVQSLTVSLIASETKVKRIKDTLSALK